MSKETIYREDAIKAVEELPNAYNGWSDAYDKAYIISTLEEVPKADRPQGKWTNAGVLTVHCSNCKSEFHELEAMNFCPNCGADMRGEKDETD